MFKKLTCSRDSAPGLCELFEWNVEWVYCDNKKTHFECHTELPPGISFKHKDVRCTEVADRPGYVYEDSCYLDFSLTSEYLVSETVGIVLVSVLCCILLLSCVAAACGQFRTRKIIQVQNIVPSQQLPANRSPASQHYVNPAFSNA